MRGKWAQGIEPLHFRWIIKDRLAGERAFHHVGVHGGASEAELRIPLVVVGS